MYRQIIDTSSTDRVEYLASLFGFKEAVQLFHKEYYISAPLEAAQQLERLLSPEDIIQTYQTLKESDDFEVQEKATEKLQALLGE